MEQLTANRVEHLLRASNYRQFVEAMIELHANDSKTLSYADIARRAGFSARSFPRDVVKGKKRITPSSLGPFIRGLGLKGDWVAYFKLLVELEESDCREKMRTPSKISRMLLNLAERLRLDRTGPTKKPAERALFESYHAPRIYAALGSQESGAALGDIRRRTGLENDVILPVLSALENSEVVAKRGVRYFAKTNHLSLPGLKTNDIFKSFYLHLLSQASLKARTGFNSDKDLFFSSSVSVLASDLPRLKSELRSVLLNFVDAAEVAEGNQVVSISASLF